MSESMPVVGHVDSLNDGLDSTSSSTILVERSGNEVNGLFVLLMICLVVAFQIKNVL